MSTFEQWSLITPVIKGFLDEDPQRLDRLMSSSQIRRDDGISEGITGQIFDSYDATYAMRERYQPTSAAQEIRSESRSWIPTPRGVGSNCGNRAHPKDAPTNQRYRNCINIGPQSNATTIGAL
jgi:hypothetical protein